MSLLLTGLTDRTTALTDNRTGFAWPSDDDRLGIEGEYEYASTEYDEYEYKVRSHLVQVLVSYSTKVQLLFVSNTRSSC